MARQSVDYITREFPEYVEVSGLLTLASETWPRFGISAQDLMDADDYEQELIRIFLEL